MPPTPGSAIENRSVALTTLTVKVDGQALPGTVSVVAVDIVRQLNRISYAHLLLHDGDAAKQEFELSSGDLLTPGKTLEIEGGYNKDETLLFKGVITGQRIQVKRRGDSLLHIQARDPAFRLTLARKSRYFSDLSDSDLFEEILTGYSDLTAEVEATTVTYPEIVQYQVTDWDFLVTRAEKMGLFCLPDDGIFRIAKPDLAQAPALSLTYGRNIFDMDLEMDARTQASKVTATAWDHANQTVISAEVEDAQAPNQGNLTGADLAEVNKIEGVELRHSGALQQQEVDAWAAAGMLKSRLAKIRGSVCFQGNAAVKPGGLVELSGLGERFKGTAFVSGVRHFIGGGDWQTTIEVGLPQTWHHAEFEVNAVPAAGFHPAINGLHTGIVTGLQDDPEGEERILVRLPLIDSAADGVWSRLATLDAGNERGTVFRPEIGDEVIVGFVNDDPHEPVVLGMLHSSNKPAPLPASDDNHEKGLVTRSGMKLLFNDETPSLTIATAKGKQIVIDDKDGSIVISDETGNSVTLNSDGIALESAKAIKLKAQQDVTIEGLNIELKARAAVTVEGSASAALKSSGTTEVKGSLVQIN